MRRNTSGCDMRINCAVDVAEQEQSSTAAIVNIVTDNKFIYAAIWIPATAKGPESAAIIINGRHRAHTSKSSNCRVHIQRPKHFRTYMQNEVLEWSAVGRKLYVCPGGGLTCSIMPRGADA